MVAAAVAATGLAAICRAGLGPTSQLFGSFPYRGEATERTVALTFDDGPNEPWTSRLLDVLADKGVPATFFQVGRCARCHPEVTRRVVAEGHVLADHSESHAFSRHAREPTQRRELERGRATLHEVSGRIPLLYRPPWLCHWPWVLRGIAGTGSQVVSGTFAHPLEILQPRPEVLVAGAVRRVRPGGIVILHDGREAHGGHRGSSVAAVRREGFAGYDTSLTQGGDEVDLLRRLRRQGRVRWDARNAVRTSSRRVDQGLAHTVFVSSGYYYAAGYVVNRLARRQVVGSAPPIRPDDEARVQRVRRRWHLIVVGVAATAALGHLARVRASGRSGSACRRRRWSS